MWFRKCGCGLGCVGVVWELLVWLGRCGLKVGVVWLCGCGLGSVGVVWEVWVWFRRCGCGLGSVSVVWSV